MLTSEQLKELAKLVRELKPYNFSFFLHHVPESIIPEEYKIREDGNYEVGDTFCGVIFVNLEKHKAFKKL